MGTSRPDKPLISKREADRAEEDFIAFYEDERTVCFHAPANPQRTFRLLMKVYQEEYSGRVCLWQFLGCVYDALGYHTKDGKLVSRLFAKFDLTKYRGRLTPEKHFLNLLIRSVRRRLERALCLRTDQRRPDEGPRFVGPGRVRTAGLHCVFREWRLPMRSSWRYGPQRLLENLSDRPWPPGEEGRGQLEDVVREALGRLNTAEREIIRLTHFEQKPFSARRIGRALGLDHKTVRKYRDAAMTKLQRYFQNER